MQEDLEREQLLMLKTRLPIPRSSRLRLSSRLPVSLLKTDAGFTVACSPLLCQRRTLLPLLPSRERACLAPE